MATDMLDAQSSEDLVPLLQRRLVLRGTVPAEGWAEAEKAIAPRNPGQSASTAQYSDTLLA